jgi:hypothetical protein
MADTDTKITIDEDHLVVAGGPGSGNHGHKGRPGEVGGSAGDGDSGHRGVDGRETKRFTYSDGRHTDVKEAPGKFDSNGEREFQHEGMTVYEKKGMPYLKSDNDIHKQSETYRRASQVTRDKFKGTAHYNDGAKVGAEGNSLTHFVDDLKDMLDSQDQHAWLAGHAEEYFKEEVRNPKSFDERKYKRLEHDAYDELPRLLHLAGATGKVRREMLHGRPHIVVPVVALMEGVISPVNAGGLEFVPLATLQKAAASWNGRPVTLGHPVKNGRQCSANAPDILTTHYLGQIFNSHVEGKKLLQEAWIDEARAKDLDALMLQRLLENQPEEVSVGAFVHTLEQPGTFHGKAYGVTWSETMGDHLAFLPGKRGACSIAMGCGTHRAAEEMPIIHQVHDDYLEILGGPGSGNFGHKGRPGEVGGSADGGGEGGSGKVSGYSLVKEQDGKVQVISTGHTKAEAIQASLKLRKTQGDDYHDVVSPTGRNIEHNTLNDRDQVIAKEGRPAERPAYQIDDEGNISKIPQPRDPGYVPPLGDDESVDLDDDTRATGKLGEEVQMKGSHLPARVTAVDRDRVEVEHETSVYGRVTVKEYTPEEFRKKFRRLEHEMKYKDCAACDGSGTKDGNPCETCDGEGRLKTAEDEGECLYCLGSGVNADGTECEDCGGTGMKNLEEAKPSLIKAAMAFLKSLGGPHPSFLKLAKSRKLEHDAEVVELVQEEITESADTIAAETPAEPSAEEVDRILTEKAAAGEAAFKAACRCEEKHMKPEERKDLIGKLVVDKHSGFTAGDEKMLEAASDERLESFRVAAESRANTERDLKAAADRKLTAAEFMEVAPPEIKTLIKRQERQETEMKAALITELKAAQSEYSEAELSVMAVEDLARMARVAKVEIKTDYSGKALPKMVAAEEDDYTPPNPYEKGIKALQQARA